MSEFTKMLGTNLRAARRRHKLTQEQVAESVKLPVEVYGRMERGSMLPRLEMLVALCQVLGTTPNQLLGFSRSRSGPTDGAA